MRDRRDLPTFRDAYRKRRCIVPVDGFFEWKAIKGQKAKQPYAIAMKDGAPFGLAGIWENWKEPTSGEWLRTFAIITTDANELVADIHDRMPVILAPADYARWLGDEPDPRDLMQPFPADLMRMWSISTRVNRERRSLDCGADRIGNGCGVASSAMSRGVSYFSSHEAKRHRLGPGDCARPRWVRGRKRSCRQERMRTFVRPSATSFRSTSTTQLCASARSSLTARAIIGRWTRWVRPTSASATEKQLISAFCEKIAELSPQLVTFNGNSFDLPVLRYRAMIHGISAPGLAVRPYFNRYTEDAVDLCDILSSFAPHTKASLNELSKIMGMPGKPEGIDGTDVEPYFLEGKIKEIADYCETDVVNTYRVWLRYELFRGRLRESEHQASERSLTDFIGARVHTKDHLNRLIQGRSAT